MPKPEAAGTAREVRAKAASIVDDRDASIEDQFRALEGPQSGTPSAPAGAAAAAKRILASNDSDDDAKPQQTRLDLRSVHAAPPNALGDRTESSVSASATPRPAQEPKRDPRATRKGVVTYDDSPHKLPVAAAATAALAQAADVPFLPRPGTRPEQEAADQRTQQPSSSPPLEPPTTLAVSPRANRAGAPSRGQSTASSASNTSKSGESHIRAKAGQLVNDRDKSKGEREHPQSGSEDPPRADSGLSEVANPKRQEVPSPEQERQSKQAVEDVLSRLEGHTPRTINGRMRDDDAPTEDGVEFQATPVTEFSVRSSGGRKTPITQFSSRGTRGAPATGFGSLYSPRHRHSHGKGENRAEGANGVELSTTPRSMVPITHFSSRRSSTTPTLEPPEQNNDDGPKRWIGSGPPSVISVGPAASGVSKKREMMHALSSDDDADATDTSPPSRAVSEKAWTNGDQYEGMKLPPSGIRKMALQTHRDGQALSPPKDGKTPWEYKHHHRETSRRANGVSQAMRREWASQILGELKARYDAQNRGVKPFFGAWRYFTELNNVHYHLLALETRRNDRSRLRRFIHAWHVDAHEIARVRNLIARESRKFCLRLYQAYFHNWKLRTGRTSRKAHIVFRVMWREMKRGFTDWAAQVGEVLWLRDRLWQLRERSCHRVLRLCFIGMRDVMQSKKHMRLFSKVLCRDLLTETVVFIHAWRNHVRELNSLQTRGRRCEYRWLTFELYTAFHSWLRAYEDVKFARGRMRKADIFMTETLLLKFYTGWLQAMDRMRYLAHAGLSIVARHERVIIKDAFEQLHHAHASNEQLRIALTALLEKHINRVIFGVFRAWFAMIYKVRMNFRSQLVSKTHSVKMLSAILQAWHVRHIFWRRMRQKFKVLRLKYQRDLEYLTLEEWRIAAKRYWDRVKKVELTQRLHSARLYTSTFQRWQRWTKNYTARVIALAGWAISRRDLMSISGAIKTWKMGVDEDKTLILKGQRLQFLVMQRTLVTWTRLWRDAVALNRCRSLEFERARCRVNRCILQSALDLWLFAHGNFCSKVYGMQKLMSKNASRYLSEHFHVWRGLVEFYFRREIVLQQNAIRRAYSLASRVFRFWKSIENGIVISESGDIDRETIDRMLADQKAACKTFQGIKGLLVATGVQNKAVEALRKKILMKSSWQAFQEWIGQHEFAKFAVRVHRIFDRRANLRYFTAWKFAHRLNRQLEFHSVRWNERDLESKFGIWKDKTLRSKRVAVLFCRGEERSLRGIILDWRKCVDIRKSLALKFGLLRQMQRKCFERLLHNKGYKKRMSHLHKMLFQRIAHRRLTETTRYLHNKTKKSILRHRRYTRCVEMVKTSNMKSCWNSWRRWVFTKKKALEAVDQIIDHM